MLLTQAQAEVLGQELDIAHLRAALQRMRRQRVAFAELAVPSPFALPLMVKRLREQLTTEKLKDRLGRLLLDMDRAADAGAVAATPRRRRGAGR